jgi:hypothetical protein
VNPVNFLLLDAARMHGDIYQAREMNPENTCLYEGDSEKFLGAVAPWLFGFEQSGEFAAWVLRSARGNSWGIFMRSGAEPVRLYKHLRKFLIVQSEEGKEMYFRYYDPRVLRVFLPTCEPPQLKEFFGPVEAFLAENEQGLLVEYALVDGKLTYTETGLDLLKYFNVQELPPPVPVPLDKVGPPVPEGSAPAPETPAPPPPSSASPKRSISPTNEPGNWDFGY